MPVFPSILLFIVSIGIVQGSQRLLSSVSSSYMNIPVFVLRNKRSVDGRLLDPSRLLWAEHTVFSVCSAFTVVCRGSWSAASWYL